MPIAYGLWPMAYGLWPMACDLLPMPIAYCACTKALCIFACTRFCSDSSACKHIKIPLIWVFCSSSGMGWLRQCYFHCDQ